MGNDPACLYVALTSSRRFHILIRWGKYVNNKGQI